VAPLTVGSLFTLVDEEMQSTFVVARWHGVGMRLFDGGGGANSRFLTGLGARFGMTK